ncbi:hypothetical protein RB195_020627 [Necator americanus]|uniref:Phosphatidylethanolamine-binding protein n=1 Tax=Necator americanus TaxID=51031 RepID=A0ABR1CN58_NECAM
MGQRLVVDTHALPSRPPHSTTNHRYELFTVDVVAADDDLTPTLTTTAKYQRAHPVIHKKNVLTVVFTPPRRPHVVVDVDDVDAFADLF